MSCELPGSLLSTILEALSTASALLDDEDNLLQVVDWKVLVYPDGSSFHLYWFSACDGRLLGTRQCPLLIPSGH